MIIVHDLYCNLLLSDLWIELPELILFKYDNKATLNDQN